MDDMYFKFSGKDTYKAVKQYIENGLGLNKENIEHQIKEEALDRLQNIVIDQDIIKLLNERIDWHIEQAMKHYGSGYPCSCSSAVTASVASLIKSRVNAEIDRQVSEAIKDKITVYLKLGNQ